MEENTKIVMVDDELADMNADLELQKYHDRVASGQLTKEEKIARENMNKIMEMPMEDFLKGNFDNIK